MRNSKRSLHKLKNVTERMANLPNESKNYFQTDRNHMLLQE